ncbi:hypothetical protein FPV67DRAFT_1503354 [Lyophyllum atratum]|nr:hypothetical protein FPV67DRAFT_1503354 [Lyophyllum atratum]
MEGIHPPLHDVNHDLPLEQPHHLAPRAKRHPQSEVDHAGIIHTIGLRLLLTYPHVNACKLYSFIEENITAHGDAVVDVAQAAIRNGWFELEGHNLGSRKRKHDANDGDGNVDEEQALEGENPAKRLKFDYGNKDRPYNGGQNYFALAVDQLQSDFPDAPGGYIMLHFINHNSLYAPTHLYLLLDEQTKQLEQYRKNERIDPPYAQRNVPFVPNKGKGRELEDPEFSRERAWLLELLAAGDAGAATEEAQEFDETVSGASVTEAGSSDESEECGCCFSTFPSSEMVSCDNSHCFCNKCVERHSANLLVIHKPDIKCMSMDGCEASFSASALRQCLPEKLLNLWERLSCRSELEAAGLKLEDCPFCDWGYFIDAADEQEQLFNCQNCNRVSCRACKKQNHLPKTCNEAQEDKKLEGRHVIEEAMTGALVRKCPHCTKPFVKEDGCNKMTCAYCRGISCYVCRQPIKDYEHFENNAPGRPGPSKATGKCLLLDSVEERHHAEVKQAAVHAFVAFKRDNPDVRSDDLEVALPPPPQPNSVPQRRRIPGVRAHPLMARANYGAPRMELQRQAVLAYRPAAILEILRRLRQHPPPPHNVQDPQYFAQPPGRVDPVAPVRLPPQVLLYQQIPPYAPAQPPKQQLLHIPQHVQAPQYVPRHLPAHPPAQPLPLRPPSPLQYLLRRPPRQQQVPPHVATPPPLQQGATPPRQGQAAQQIPPRAMPAYQLPPQVPYVGRVHPPPPPLHMAAHAPAQFPPQEQVPQPQPRPTQLQAPPPQVPAPPYLGAQPALQLVYDMNPHYGARRNQYLRGVYGQHQMQFQYNMLDQQHQLPPAPPALPPPANFQQFWGPQYFPVDDPQMVAPPPGPQHVQNWIWAGAQNPVNAHQTIAIQADQDHAPQFYVPQGL